MFFSEEKNQKTFVSSLAEPLWPRPYVRRLHQKNKSLLVLFFRKEHAFFLRALSMPNQRAAMFVAIERKRIDRVGADEYQLGVIAVRQRQAKRAIGAMLRV